MVIIEINIASAICIALALLYITSSCIQDLLGSKGFFRILFELVCSVCWFAITINFVVNAFNGYSG